MNAPNKDRVNRLVLELLAEDPDDAAVALFTRLCRQSPKLRAWLWDEFARSPKTRAEFARIFSQPGVKGDNLTLAHAAGEDRARSVENARLRGDWLKASTLRPYGGLSRPEIEGMDPALPIWFAPSCHFPTRARLASDKQDAAREPFFGPRERGISGGSLGPG